MENKKSWKVCSECSKLINVTNGKDKYVYMATRNREENRLDEDAYYHFQCFVDWINERVKEKAVNTITNMQNEHLRQLGMTTNGTIPLALKDSVNEILKINRERFKESQKGKPKRIGRPRKY